jgi:hypothetical protein
MRRIYATYTELPEGGLYREYRDPEGDKLRINGVSYLDLWGDPLDAEKEESNESDT